MKMNNVRKYIDLRDSLAREKAKLEERLAQINEALGHSMSAPAEASAPVPPLPAARRGGRRSGKGGLSLRDAVLQATAKAALTKQEILNAIHAIGYRFSTKNPLNSLGVILYGKKPRFKNQDGRFSPVGGASAPASSSADSLPVLRKRPKLSREARERIAAAQRARWAKVKAGK